MAAALHMGRPNVEEQEKSAPITSLTTTVWIAPYDLGVSQLLELHAEPTAREDVFRLALKLVRQSGDPENWVLVNKRFLGHLRRQFLTWQALTHEDRQRYLALGR